MAKKTPIKILTTSKANSIRKIALKKYAASISSVYDYGNELGLTYSLCKGCEAETPTLRTVVLNECLICGGAKD
jgi:hypothetical protein